MIASHRLERMRFFPKLTANDTARQLDQSLTPEVQERREPSSPCHLCLEQPRRRSFCEFYIVTRLDDERLESRPRPVLTSLSPVDPYSGRPDRHLTDCRNGVFQDSRRLLSKSDPDINRPVIFLLDAQTLNDPSLIDQQGFEDIGVSVLAANSARTGSGPLVTISLRSRCASSSRVVASVPCCPAPEVINRDVLTFNSHFQRDPL